MDHSPLAKLPAELRNRVYELSLHHDKPFILTGSARRRKGTLVPLHKLREPYALLVTCRQIRKEATQLLYALNSFVVHGSRHDRKSQALRRFLGDIGESNTNALRHIGLDLSGGTLAGLYSGDDMSFEEKFSKPVLDLQSVAKCIPQCAVTVTVPLFGYTGIVATQYLDLRDLDKPWEIMDHQIEDEILAATLYGAKYPFYHRGSSYRLQQVRARLRRLREKLQQASTAG